ncbi:hypothetical protein SXCC_01251 [Gluconacetobacter sp. SXCC-1]|nr:hypothetical protein SXCC_01251 [Gluconacetobacter sp. SXCC-1]
MKARSGAWMIHRSRTRSCCSRTPRANRMMLSSVKPVPVMPHPGGRHRGECGQG